MQVIVLLGSWMSIAVLSLQAQEPTCTHGRADQRFSLTVPVDVSRDILIDRADTIFALLGYMRAGGKPGSTRYRTAWMLDWPAGTDSAPWRTHGPSPGVRLDVRFSERSDSTARISVNVDVLCAVRSREASRGDFSTEHLIGLFAAMQVITALTMGMDAAIRGFATK